MSVEPPLRKPALDENCDKNVLLGLAMDYRGLVTRYTLRKGFMVFPRLCLLALSPSLRQLSPWKTTGSTVMWAAWPRESSHPLSDSLLLLLASMGPPGPAIPEPALGT